MSWRDKRPLKPFEWGFLVLLLAVLLYVAASLWGVVTGGLPNLGRALADGEIRFAVGLSLWTTTLSTLLCILIGIPCAYLLAFTPLPGKRWAEALVGFQPALIAALSRRFSVKVLDLNPDNIGKVKDGCPVLDGEADRQAVVDWAGLVLCTGSTLCNGTIVDYLDLDKEVVFFGTTLAGAAPILGLKRACFADRSQEEA